MGSIFIPGTANPGDVLSGKGFSAGVNYGATGTMPNLGGLSITPSGLVPLTISAGYTSGGTVSQVNVPAANVLSGTTIAGVAGTMLNHGNAVLTPWSSNVPITDGYYSGAYVAAVSFDSSKVLSGTTIAGTNGTMPNNGAPTWIPSATDQAISSGYYSGGTVKAGKRFATGTASGTTLDFGGGNYAAGFSVRGLNFAPRWVVAILVVNGTTRAEFYIGYGDRDGNIQYSDTSNASITHTCTGYHLYQWFDGSAWNYDSLLGSSEVPNGQAWWYSDGFDMRMPSGYQGRSFQWHAVE